MPNLRGSAVMGNEKWIYQNRDIKMAQRWKSKGPARSDIFITGCGRTKWTRKIKWTSSVHTDIHRHRIYKLALYKLTLNDPVGGRLFARGGSGIRWVRRHFDRPLPSNKQANRLPRLFLHSWSKQLQLVNTVNDILIIWTICWVPRGQKNSWQAENKKKLVSILHSIDQKR